MITVKKLHPLFMAEIGGVDLAQPLSQEEFAEIEAAFNEHAVLLFRDQSIDDEQQAAFSRWFGPLIPSTKYHRPGEVSRLGENMADVSNMDHEGRLLDADASRRMHSQANQLWHTDASFKHVPARCSLLSAHVIPPTGGETEFADLRAAYDALPEERKQEIEGLVAEHSIFESRAKMDYTDYTDGARAELPPVQQVLYRVHPGSGRKTLYLAAHAAHIIGWPEDKGRRLLEELMEHATQPQFVYTHTWKVADLVMWDNRCTMHRARPYEDLTYRRDMRRTTVSDEVNTVERLQGAVVAAE